MKEFETDTVPEQMRDEYSIVRSAALLALKKARMHGTKLAVKRNGKVELETPDEFEKHLPKDIQ